LVELILRMIVENEGRERRRRKRKRVYTEEG
jgi:hypothetical protein